MYKTTLLVVNVIFEGHGRIIIKESCKSFDLQDSLAERGGFEPPDTLLAYTRFPGVPLKPLEHLSS